MGRSIVPSYLRWYFVEITLVLDIGSPSRGGAVKLRRTMQVEAFTLPMAFYLGEASEPIKQLLGPPVRHLIADTDSEPPITDGTGKVYVLLRRQRSWDASVLAVLQKDGWQQGGLPEWLPSGSDEA
jgi:hypothetical protein